MTVKSNKVRQFIPAGDMQVVAEIAPTNWTPSNDEVIAGVNEGAIPGPPVLGGSWTSDSKPVNFSNGAFACEYGSDILVGGGNNATTGKHFWTVDSSLTFTPITDNSFNGFGCSIAVGANAYVWMNVSSVGKVTKWNGSSWSTLTNSPNPIFSAAILDGVIYVVDWNSTLYSYNPVGDSYTTIGTIDSAHYDYYMIFPYNHKLYCIGPHDSNTTRLYSYSVGVGFTRLSDPSHARSDDAGGVILDGGQILIAGGFISGSPFETDTVEIYSVEDATWSDGPSIPAVAADINGFIINDNIYMLDDWNNDLIHIDFTPSSDPAVNEGWKFIHRSNGKLRFSYSIDGSTLTDIDSTVAVPFSTGQGWIKVTIHNIVSDSQVKFYTSLDSITWTQLGTTVNAGEQIIIFPSAADLEIGSTTRGTDGIFDGIIYSVEVRDGIDGVIVANPNFRSDPQNHNSSSFRDNVGNLFTIGSGELLSGGIEYVDQGTFYADTFQVDSTGMVDEIACRDISKFMQETTKDTGLIFKDVTAAEAISGVAKEAGVLNSNISYDLPYSRQIIKDQPVAYWDFSQLGLDNWAFNFDGATRLTSPRYFYMNKVGKNDNTVVTPTYIEFWINPQTSQDATIFNYSESSNVDKFTIKLTTASELKFYTDNTLNGTTSGLNLSVQQWNHITVKRDGGTITTYLNGIPTGGTVSESTSNFGDTHGYITLGNKMTTWPSTFGSEFFAGALDDVRIWAGDFEDILERIPVDVNKNGFISTYGKEYNSLAFFSMSEGTGNTIASSKDSFNTLEVNGNAGWIKTGVGTLKDKASKINATIRSVSLFGGDSPFVSETGRSYQFDGASSWVVVPFSDSTLQFSNNESTTEAWVYKDNSLPNNTNNTLICKVNSDSINNNKYNIGITHDNKVFLQIGGTTSDGTISTNEWVHVAVSTDSSHTYYYINGVLDSVKAFSNISSDTNQLIIGWNGDSSWWPGKMASLVLFDRKLTDDEIANHYKAALIPAPKVFDVLWAQEDTLWGSMLSIALGDLGMFYLTEEDVLRYESALAFYNDQYSQHTDVQWHLDQNKNIVSGSQSIELLINKVIVTVNPTQSLTNPTTEIWNANSGESLAATTLTSALSAASNGSGSALSFLTTVNDAGILEPIFPANGFIRIGDEIIKYDSRDDFHLYGLTRGLFNTSVGSYGIGEFVGEAREYNLQWSTSPVIMVKYPFITAQTFDGTVDVNLWTSNPTSGHLVISLTAGFDPQNIYQVLQGTNPVSGLDNFFAIAGIPAQDTNAKGTTSEVSSDYAQKIRRYGLKDLTIDNPFIQDAAYAKQVADFVLLHNSSPIKVITIQTIGLPHLQLSDRIEIDEFAQLSIAGINYWIMDSEIEYNGGVSQTLTLKQVD